MNASNRSSCYLHTKFSHTLKPPVLRICITSSLCNPLAALILHPLLPSLSHQHRHGLRGSVSPVLTATSLVNGKWQFSTPYRIDTPRPIIKKFVLGDYVGNPYSCAKFGAHPPIGDFWANGWNITIILNLFIPVFGNSNTGQTRWRIFANFFIYFHAL